MTPTEPIKSIGGSMKESNELFELCRQVYEATGWIRTPWTRFPDSGLEGIEPFYTSDYLLKKLPRQIEDVPLCLWAAGRSDWMAEYDGTGQFEGVNERISMLSDTPLKALLLLTLKLHEEGLL